LRQTRLRRFLRVLFRPPALSLAAGRWRRALGFAASQQSAILKILGLTLLQAGLNATEPLLLKRIFDGLISSKAFAALASGIGGMVLLGLAREAVVGRATWLTWRTRLRIHSDLLNETVGRLHRIPLRLQRSEGVGAVMTLLDRGIQGFLNALGEILFNVFPSVLFLALSVGIMWRLQWKLALLALAFTPLPPLISCLASPEQIRRERSLMDQWAKIYSRFNEVLSGILIVRSFSMEEAEKRRFLSDVDQANQRVIRGVGIDAGFGAASNLVIAAARISAIAFGGFLVLQGQVTLGTLVAFLGYVGSLFGPVQGLSGIYQTVQRGTVALEQILDILDTQESLGDAPDAKELEQLEGRIAFEKVHFSYEAKGMPLLKGIDLDVGAGETIAIVGPSGSGKTTLMALLMRFYEPQQGTIRLDGVDLCKIKQRSLRRRIGVVLQDPLLFNESIRANIAYGRPEASMPEIEAAARAANAHDFISRMPEGYDTIVGERGSLLSIGERQRVTIARALLKDPAILVLDEATSSLDAESEALVQGALEELMRGRTTFVIAHRLSTVVHADRIVVLREGLIAESGTHRELLARGGYYASLVRKQIRGLIRNEGEIDQGDAPIGKKIASPELLDLQAD
jgi:ATP-binding cassette subfamily B protein